MNKRSKGITPVIAIVLLLALTVAAVGIVWTQFQGFVGQADQEAGFLESQSITIQTVTRGDNDTMDLNIQNTGDENEYNLSDLTRLEVSVPGEDRLAFDLANESFGVVETNVSDAFPRGCFTTHPNASTEVQTLSPQGTASCDTGIEMPSVSEEITLHIVEDGTDEEIAQYTCSPSTSDSATC
jgi:flagellin-like protein